MTFLKILENLSEIVLYYYRSLSEKFEITKLKMRLNYMYITYNEWEFMNERGMLMIMDALIKKRYKAWKRRKMIKRLAILSILPVVLLGGISLGFRSIFDRASGESLNAGINNKVNMSTTPINFTEEMEEVVFCGFFEPDDVMILNNAQSLSYLALVNNCYGLSREFIPDDLSVVNVASVGGEHLLRVTAARAAEELFAHANEAGHILLATSGYRSFATQEVTHNYWVNQLGEEQARRVSARPGHSEHQLGLALDVSTPHLGGDLTEDFALTPEGMWVDRNAHLFGFIISYPSGREKDTGFSYEPWHIRYVGVETATEIYNNNLILEEYLWYND